MKENGIGIPIIGGDFNETLNNIDRISASNNHKNNKPVSSLKSLLKDNNLIDIWRVMNENIQQFTWRRKDKSQASRIDLILIDSNLIPQIDTCKIKPATIQYTDHLSVCLTFKTGASEKGRGFWKLNNSVLENKDYQSLINNLITNFLNQYQNRDTDCRIFWDILKLEIKETTVTYCKSKAKTKREVTHTLEKELQEKIVERDQLNLLNSNLDDRIKNLESELNKIYDEKAIGAQIRA